MSAGLYSGVSGLALGTGLYKGTQGLWGGSSGLVNEFGASLALNFLSGTALDSRITFSRTTNATLVDATGRVTYAPNNLSLYSEQFDNAVYIKVRASITANATTSPNGTTTADKLVEDTTATSTHLIQLQGGFSSFVSGTTYVISGYAKAGERTSASISMGTDGGVFAGQSANFNFSTGVISAQFGVATFAMTDAGNGWYRWSIAATPAGSGAAFIRFQLIGPAGGTSYTGDGTSGLFIWGAQLEAVTYQTLPSTYVQTVASAYYGPRFDYNPVTLAPRGLLIEEQRVNLVLYSDQFDNAAWTKTGSTITANATTSPDGTVNAEKLVENTAATTQHRIQQAVTTVSGTSYTYSVYLKAGERIVVTMRIIGAGTFAGCTINLTAGTISAITGAATITNAGNGWYRVSVTGTADSTTSTCYVNLTDGSSITYTGNGVSGAFLYGAQLEAGAFPTSYIPTVASTVTRAADSVAITGTNFSSWYNASEGTIVVSADSSRGGTPASARVFLFVDGTGTNIIRSNGQSTLQVIDTSVTQASIAGVPLIPFDGTVFKFASAYKLDDFATVTTGAVVTDTSGTVPTGINQLVLGGGSSSTIINGHIRTFTYYPQRLANAQLQAVTA